MTPNEKILEQIFKLVNTQQKRKNFNQYDEAKSRDGTI